MSDAAPFDALTQRVSSGSAQTLTSRPLQPVPDPSASKRVCFYRSGDPKFAGHRVIVNGRTFKTFDALLDALSKKVPLPFGVRKISTPRGTHAVRGLEDLQDGGSYVCSDRRRIKPLNLDAVVRRQVPWNTARPPSTGRRRYGAQSRGSGRATARSVRRASVWTPKRLVVVKNRDPKVKRTVVLQRRTAPSFDALLDYLSQVMQFRVLRLYSTDGRRVDGLAALILCSGVIVAAGNEPFRLGNYNLYTLSHYNLHTIAYISQSSNSDAAEPATLQHLTFEDDNKPQSSGTGSRKFSLSSERYIADQINKSLNGSINAHSHPHNESPATDPNKNPSAMDTKTWRSVQTQEPPHSCVLPEEEDIEKSFRVNEDGSMTVEMRVRLTIKEEELLHWTTTLSRSNLHPRTACASKSGTGNSSPDSNNAMAKDSPKEENHPAANNRKIGLSGERAPGSYTPAEFRRVSTPGSRHMRKNASLESFKTVTESGFQESTIGRYTYTEKTAEAEVTEEYSVVRHSNHSSSSSGRPVPRPRGTASAAPTDKALHPSIQSSVVANDLQVDNNGVEITETVMHIYERQGGCDNLAKNEYMNEDMGNRSSKTPRSTPACTESRQHSGSVDCDVDFTPPSSTADSTHGPTDVFSLSSEPISLKQTPQSLNDSRSKTNPRRIPAETNVPQKHNPAQGWQNKKAKNPTGRKKSSPSSRNSEAKQNESSSKKTNSSSSEKLREDKGKKSGSSSDSGKKGQKGRETELLQTAEKGRRSNKPSHEQQNIEQVNGRSTKREVKRKDRAPRENGLNLNYPEKERPDLRKNLLNIVQPKQLHGQDKKGMNKQKSLSEKKIALPKHAVELSESVSMPVINPLPSEVHQYVEKWLETQMSPDSVPYMEEAALMEPEPLTKVAFHIGGDSESEALNECQPYTSSHNPLQGDALLSSRSCLAVPIFQEVSTTDDTQRVRGLCTSMPSVRIDPAEQNQSIRLHRSSEAIGDVEREPSSSTSNLLTNQATLNPVLRQLCSSIQCIRRTSEPENHENIKKSKSLADFSTQVASVFGSPSKAFVSFLSAMTLRETLKGAVAGESYDSRTPSEAMLVMESLQKISTIEDEVLQRSSLTDLHSRTSSELKDSWRDFQVLGERLKSDPLSPKSSDQEFALDVASEAGDTLADQSVCIQDLMEELNLPQDLREEISSTFQHTKSFYPEEEESTFVVRENYNSETDDELENFQKEQQKETNQSQETQSLCQKTILSVQENECGSEILVNTKMAEDVEHDRIVETQDEDGNSDMSVKDKSEREDVGDENMEDEMEMWKEEEANTTDQAETGEFNRGEATEESSGEVGFTDKDEEVDEEVGELEDGKQDVLEGKEPDSGEGDLEEGSTVDEEVAGEEDEQLLKKENIGESKGEQGEGDVAEMETGEESGEETDEESCRKDNEEVKDDDVESDFEDEQEVAGEQSPDEEREDDLEEHALDLSMRVEETDLNDEDDEETSKMVEAAADVSSGEECNNDNSDDEKANANREEDTDEARSQKTRLGSTAATAHARRADGKEDQEDEQKRSQIPQPVEISQGLIDFVNSALQSSSLIFTYDALGNLRIEPDHANIVHTKQIQIPKSIGDSLYGLKQLPSPGTSDLSDYRPETSESGGYNTQGSVEIVTESGDECENVPLEYGDSTRGSEMSDRTAERLKTEGSVSSPDSGTEASKEVLSYSSAASSLKADPEAAAHVAGLNSDDGVLIDKGRWLLKENHLIRKSPPAPMGMYDDVDSLDTDPDNSSEDSHPQSLTNRHPLAVISSSDLEEMAKPQGPKCTYYNMPHGSDSDPFMDDLSIESSKRRLSNSKGKAVKVSPAINTSTTWPKKNGSLSSFASVEFNMQGSRVHPEGGTATAAQARRPPSGAGHALRAPDPVDTFRGRCGQYCPIL